VHARSVPYAGLVPLDASGARRFYDRMGRWQDTQRFYEDAATRRLTVAANFAEAGAVFELGCGTGRYAAGLLARELPREARYLGVDVSPTMVGLARERLAAWAPRAEVRLLDPPARTLPGADGSFDRFLAMYVFDLLTADDARALIDEAHRLLRPDGLLALVSLTHGTTPASTAVSSAWGAIATRWPTLAGGCRPIELRELLDASLWRELERDVVTRWAVPSEVLVAVRGQDP
jgi:ubiquinone/menaquinone biosynthesis C-methylase UbiE